MDTDSMLRRARDQIRRLIAHPRAPAITLALILVFSLAARIFDINQPCTSPCATVASHTLIFDEAYYVNAARVIDGIRPPSGDSYATAPLHKDPNAEHPQLAKLIIAGGIELFGDDPWGWRIGSVIFGLIAIGAMYALVRAVGGSPWLAVGASAVMSMDNLMLMHGRIATLDIYYVATTLIAVALYVHGSTVTRNGRWWALAGGVALGVAGCMKLVAFGVLPAIVLFEAFQLAWARGEAPGVWPTLRARALAFAVMTVPAFAVLFAGVWLMDVLVPAYDPGTHITYAGSPFTHIAHMLSYAAKLKSIPDATGISSTPWQWLVDEKPINYATVAVNSISGGKIVATKDVFAARGEINQFIIFLAIPALFAAVAAAWYERDRVAALGAAWCVGTFLPLAVEAQVYDRTSYLYYMLIVMPGIYMLTARLFSPSRVPRAATIGWGIALIYGFIDLYPVQRIH
ncbi:MAG: phospholipid carrier-dependent glycosyltransferase [Solirubrobacteraceae bacterium]